MTSNVFVRLRRMLPEPPVIIGRVIAHHPEDDTSSIQLPSETPSVSYADDGVSAGSVFRARGRTVDVGLRAFVRAVEIVIGSVCRHVNLTYVGPITVPSMTVGVPVSFGTATAWTGGIAPIVYTVLSGTLPAGLTLNPVTGVISGTPTTVASYPGVVLRATDNSSFYADSVALAFTVIGDPLFSQVQFLLSPATIPLGGVANDQSLFARASTQVGGAVVSNTRMFSGGPTLDFSLANDCGFAYPATGANWFGSLYTTWEAFIWVTSLDFAFNRLIFATDSVAGLMLARITNFPDGVVRVDSFSGSDTSNAITTGAWVHVCALYDPSGLGSSGVYINGVRGVTSPGSPAAFAGTGQMYAGAVPAYAVSGNRSLLGQCAGIRVTAGPTAAALRYDMAGFTPPSTPFQTS
jgi:Putative Ig domain